MSTNTYDTPKQLATGHSEFIPRLVNYHPSHHGWNYLNMYSIQVWWWSRVGQFHQHPVGPMSQRPHNVSPVGYQFDGVLIYVQSQISWTSYKPNITPNIGPTLGGVGVSHMQGNFDFKRHDCRHFADDIFERISLNKIVWMSFKIPLEFVSRGQIYNIPALVQIMAWRRPDDKPLSKLMMVNLLTHICVTWPKWVNICVMISHFCTHNM